MSRSSSTWFTAITAMLVVLACACSQPAPAPGPGPGSGSTGGPGPGDDDDDVTTPGDDDDDTEPLPGQGEKCRASDNACAEPWECVEYYGIAGPSGPSFTSCEMRCEGGCPDGQKCTVIADGPGEVCRAP